MITARQPSIENEDEAQIVELENELKHSHIHSALNQAKDNQIDENMQLRWKTVYIDEREKKTSSEHAEFNFGTMLWIETSTYEFMFDPN